MTETWAQRRLGAWLRESTEGTALDYLSEIRAAVVHMIDCNGFQCMNWQHRHTPGASIAPESDCAGPCGDCQSYRTGTGPGFWATRPTLELIDALEALLETREESVAS